MQNSSVFKNKKAFEDLMNLFSEFTLILFKDVDEIVSQIEANGEQEYKKMCLFFKDALENEKFSLFKEELAEILYAMSALADELFLNTKWGGKDYWSDHMLEDQFFGSEFAGEMIFRKIDKLLLENDSKNLNLGEVYLKLLALGFLGKYRGDSRAEEFIHKYRKDLFNFLLKHDNSLGADQKIFQKEYSYIIPTIHRKLLPDASIINKIAFAFVFFFFVISSVVWIFETKDLRKMMANISEIALMH